ncbi:glycosyltransferase family 29 protein [Planotetraspora thailandica]|uniref:glycosyltransferase family 29 protein n=1 Tax=Planotetraspora thailandica TaxID=487172 RepID=UPI00194EEE07|nr:glycosyltransferase family 29 protein [Planotetraspora thailandica]
MDEAIAELISTYTRVLADPEKATVIASAKTTWHKELPEILEALLQVGSKAVDVGAPEEMRLALTITDTVLSVRDSSRAAWRLRAQVLEATGQDAEAIEAHERYAALVKDDGLGTAARIVGLKQSHERLIESIRLLQEESPAAQSFAGIPGIELWAEGGDLADHGQWEQAEPRLVAALAAMVEEGWSSTEIRSALADFIDLLLEENTGQLAASTRLFELYADHVRLKVREPVLDPLLGGTEPIGVSDFRNLVAGKTICLVANSQGAGNSTMGSEIDSYDLVVRFNSYQINPSATGKRTDIHATIHKHGFNWAEKVETRLVFGGNNGLWQQSMRRRLVPGAQRYVNDRTLRWPVRDLGMMGEDVWPSIPTTGFNMLYLLDFLDVNPKIDLIGFDFYDSGAYRLPAAMKLPITPVHGYSKEKEWVLARAQAVTDIRISLR